MPSHMPAQKTIAKKAPKDAPPITRQKAFCEKSPALFTVSSSLLDVLDSMGGASGASGEVVEK